ncbi:hypothetical protein RA267_30110, partial [Pseudomonas syringae pv. tagetis]|uniref:hypothetical protein n=1 Tax=Pseudomonas syringae group genomosp. 7 TaxID=251699 RepID=UPI0037700F91
LNLYAPTFARLLYSKVFAGPPRKAFGVTLAARAASDVPVLPVPLGLLVLWRAPSKLAQNFLNSFLTVTGYLSSECSSS